MVKFITADEAVALIQDEATVGFADFACWSTAEEIYKALAKRYAETGHPKNLTTLSGITAGNLLREEDGGCGFSHISADGLLKTIIGSTVNMPPEITRKVGANEISCYCLPLGVYGHLLRAMAGKKPGVLTHVGLHTYADPRVEGCAENQKAKDEGRKICEVMEVDGKEYLLYKPIPMDICFIRGTYADEDGNISLEDDPIRNEQQEMAAAVHNNGGIVVVQVRDIVQKGTIPARSVAIYNHFVDYVVKAAPENNLQSYGAPELTRRDELLGVKKVPLGSIPPMKMSVRKIVARRAAMELVPNAMINLGIGIADGVARVANEEGISEGMTLSIETGVMGGVPTGGSEFGASVNPSAIYHITENMDWYDGGGLDLAYLSAAEVDEKGNVNVTKFGPRVAGPGGFINISQNTPTVCFLGTFMAGKSQIEIEDGKLHIIEDASVIKYKKEVEQISFSAKYAMDSGQNILYITERAVFRLTPDGVMLTEIAPGVDLEKDVLGKMGFKPLIAEDLKLMDERIFKDEKMGLHF